MAFKMKYKNLQGVVDELKGAVKAHGRQAKVIEKHIDKMEDSPMKKYKSDAQRKAVHASKAESGLKKTVSWKYGKGTYSGTLIPSMETKTHRYARTHNGKIKSLPKKK